MLWVPVSNWGVHLSAHFSSVGASRSVGGSLLRGVVLVILVLADYDTVEHYGLQAATLPRFVPA